MESPGTPNHTKSRKTGTQKNIEKQHCKKWVRGRILPSKRDSPFRGGEVSKITKIRALGSKCVPSLQERFPGTQNTQKSSKNEPTACSPHNSSSLFPKITQNHENLVIQNQETQKKKNFKK